MKVIFEEQLGFVRTVRWYVVNDKNRPVAGPYIHKSEAIHHAKRLEYLPNPPQPKRKLCCWCDSKLPRPKRKLCCWCDNVAVDPPLVYYDTEHPICDDCRKKTFPPGPSI